MLRSLAIHQPATVAEASHLMREFGDDGAFYAGGTELLIVLKEHLATVDHLIDIKRIPGLNEISLADNASTLVVGALATHRAIEQNALVREHLTALSALQAVLQGYAASFASIQQDYFRERLTDVRDVVFQGDPFADPLEAERPVKVHGSLHVVRPERDRADRFDGRWICHCGSIGSSGGSGRACRERR